MLLNNEIGRKLSNDNPNADNRTLASKVIKMFYEKGLWIAQSNENGVITIKKNKLTLEQYNAAIEEIKKKGEDGLNK